MANTPVILITGASSGIGTATARFFAEQGYRVVLAARRYEILSEIADEINNLGGDALPIKADVSNLEELHHLVETSLDRYQQIDVLFNNAGFGSMDWLEKLDPIADIQNQIQVNLLGTIWTTQAVLPGMIERRTGHIINMCSIAGLIATPTYTAYSASKFAMRGFSEALRREVGIYGIQVSTIFAGSVDTEFRQKAGIRRKTGMITPRSLRLKAEDVAKAVFDLTQHPRRDRIIPKVMQFVFWFNEVFPGIIDRIIEKRFVRPERD